MDMINIVDIAFFGSLVVGFAYFYFKERNVRKALEDDLSAAEAVIGLLKEAGNYLGDITKEADADKAQVDGVKGMLDSDKPDPDKLH